MKVRLISVTKPETYTTGNTSRTAEELIAYCARVSSNNQENPDYVKLFKYLIVHGHWSPFEMANMCVEITTSRAISPQILRHKSFSFQEFSQRYAEVTEFEEVELRLQGDSKQGSGDVFNDFDTEQKLSAHVHRSEHLYKKLIAEGVSRETARMYLPLCTQTKLYMNGTVRSWIHYLETRLKDDTQKEHRLIAEEIKQIFVGQFPIISEVIGWR